MTADEAVVAVLKVLENQGNPMTTHAGSNRPPTERFNDVPRILEALRRAVQDALRDTNELESGRDLEGWPRRMVQPEDIPEDLPAGDDKGLSGRFSPGDCRGARTLLGGQGDTQRGSRSAISRIL